VAVTITEMGGHGYRNDAGFHRSAPPVTFAEMTGHLRRNTQSRPYQYFERHVQHEHDIHTHEQLQDALNIFPDTEDGNKSGSAVLLGQ